MRNLYLMRARPFGIGTFPTVERVDYWEMDRRRDGYHCMVETVEELTFDDIDKYELIKPTAEWLVARGFLGDTEEL